MDNENTSASQPSKMNPMIIIAVVIILAIAAFFVINSQNKGTQQSAATNDTAMTKDDTPTVADEKKMVPSEAATPADAMAADDKNATVQEFTVNGGAFYYKPNTLSVKKGVPVKITFKADDMMHNLYIDELNVKSDTIKAGETTTIEFTPTKAGSFEYYCSVGQHRKNGQVGTITVTE